MTDENGDVTEEYGGADTGDGEPAGSEHPLGEKRPLDHGAKIRTKLKRGTGTRDQDVMLLEARGEDADEAIAEFRELLETATDEGWGDDLREIQPEAEE